ncbi:MAG: hypothetical protein HUK12_07000 [Muribaculaceae bacterium]|nr:hypothetical protein [Muribaculaceae bacterium]
MPFKYAGLWGVMHQDLSNEDVDRLWKTDKLDDASSLFPKDCVYMRWCYDNPDYYAHRKALNWYKSHSLTVMGATSAADGGSPFMPRHGSKTTHIRNFCKMTVEYGLQGIFATCWDDGSPHTETVARGFAALGEWGWNPESRSEEAFKRVHARREFGLVPGETDFIDELEQAAFFFDSALVVEGRRNPAWQVRDYRLIDLPNRENRGEWSVKYKDKIAAAHAQVARHDAIAAKIAAAQKNALRNRYTLDIYKENNELFLFPAKILLALENFDNAKNDAENADAEREIRALNDDFRTMRESLETVYSKTRFLENPAGYISDMNHHRHLAALTNDSSWLFLYELALLKQLARF